MLLGQWSAHIVFVHQFENTGTTTYRNWCTECSSRNGHTAMRWKSTLGRKYSWSSKWIFSESWVSSEVSLQFTSRLHNVCFMNRISSVEILCLFATRPRSYEGLSLGLSSCFMYRRHFNRSFIFVRPIRLLSALPTLPPQAFSSISNFNVLAHWRIIMSSSVIWCSTVNRGHSIFVILPCPACTCTIY